MIIMPRKAVRAVIDTSDLIQSQFFPFAEALGLSYFQFRRTFHDGSFIWISNKPHFFIDFLSLKIQGIPPSYTNQATPSQKNIYLCSEHVPPLMKSLALEKHGICDAISFAETHPLYCDLLTFGSPSRKEMPGTFFMNIFYALKEYKELFLKENSETLDRMRKTALFEVQNNPSFDKDGFKNHPFEPLKLDHKECVLMELLLQGKTTLEIAQTMKEVFNFTHQKINALLAKIGHPLYALKKS